MASGIGASVKAAPLQRDPGSLLTYNTSGRGSNNDRANMDARNTGSRKGPNNNRHHSSLDRTNQDPDRKRRVLELENRSTIRLLLVPGRPGLRRIQALKPKTIFS